MYRYSGSCNTRGTRRYIGMLGVPLERVAGAVWGSDFLKGWGMCVCRVYVRVLWLPSKALEA